MKRLLICLSILALLTSCATPPPPAPPVDPVIAYWEHRAAQIKALPPGPDKIAAHKHFLHDLDNYKHSLAMDRMIDSAIANLANTVVSPRSTPLPTVTPTPSASPIVTNPWRSKP